MSEILERKLAELLKEHIEIGYVLRPDGLVDPDTIKVTGAMGAAHMAIHFLKQQMIGAKLFVESVKK